MNQASRPHPALSALRVSLALFLLLPGSSSHAERPAEFTLSGDWTIQVKQHRWFGSRLTTLEVPPAQLLTITNERYDSLPVFNPNTAGWVKGAQLQALKAQETTTPFLLDPASVVVRSSATPDAPAFRAGNDYDFDPQWGTLGRKEGGAIGANQPVFVSYRYAPLRLDSIVRARGGRLEVRKGEPRAAAPSAPPLARSERRLANVWLPGRIARLEPKHLLPVLADKYPAPPRRSPSVAETLTPRTFAKLRAGEAVRILAWGDSVTDGGYVPDPARERWQEQFATRLRKAYPRARIELVTEAWGGRNTGSYLAEPPGSPHNYREKVLGARPDLVVSEFVNDAGLNPAQVEQRYGALLADFQGIGAEWIILTPHYVRPDWMGLDREKEIDDDPRPYVAGLREFGKRHHVAIADAAKRYGHLWREGVPYTTLMLNSINHPNAAGMAIFADALMELFP